MRQNQPPRSHNPSSRKIRRRQLKHKLFRATFSGPAGFVALLMILALSFSGRPLTTSAQDGKSREISATASLTEAQAAGYKETTSPGATEDLVAPEGGSCGWSAGTVLTAPVLDQATVVVGNNLYTFGGVSNGAITANSFKFDGTTWTPITPLPAALEFPTAVTDGTNAYIVGGALVGTGVPQTTLYRYNVAANTYTPLAPFTTPTWNQAVAFLNGKIYKWAGTSTSASTNAMEIYDIAGNTWAPGAVYPLSISFVSAFVRNGFIYSAGGIQSVGSVASLKTFRYDPAGNTWDDAAIADLPLTRWGSASSGTGYGVNGGWVLAGGYVNGTVAANISTTVIRWDPTGNNWVDMPAMPAGGDRSRTTGGILGASFYVVGGRSQASSAFVGTNSNQKFTCISNIAVPTPGTVTITAEGCGTPNNAPDPGETLTVALPVSNGGDIPTTNFTATLQATGGVTSPSGPQNYGAIPPGGGTVTKNFSFTVDPATACGGQIVLTWTLADGATTYPNVTKTYVTGVLAVSFSENFDSVTAPALPAGWTTTQTSGTGINWNTVTDTVISAPNAAFANDPVGVNASTLVSPTVAINSAAAQLSFKNKFITEATFDGMVLEFSTDGGNNWTDVITGGGSFVSGGYTGPISANFMSPILGRQAWSGTSAGGYIDTVVNLPASLNGQSVKFRWLMASDTTQASTGVWVDNVVITGNRICNNCTGPNSKARSDFDGDGKSDVSVYRPSEGIWYLLRSTAGFAGVVFGSANDKIVPGDYDGDGKTDIAVFRGGTTWFVLRSSNNTVIASVWGAAGDIPVAGDYDADGKTDFAVYRPSSNDYFVRYSSGIPDKFFHWGLAGDIPVVGDFDGDSKTDYTVFRPSTATWHTVSGGFPATYKATIFGQAGDKLVPSDFDGDHKTDIAVFRAGVWYIINSSTNTVVVQSWGVASDKAVPADFDGDGKEDIAVFRNGFWYIFGSGVNAVPEAIKTFQFGAAGDTATQTGYVPEQ